MEIQLDEKYSNLCFNDLIDKYELIVNDYPCEFLTKRKYCQEKKFLLLQQKELDGKNFSNISNSDIFSYFFFDPKNRTKSTTSDLIYFFEIIKINHKLRAYLPIEP